MWTCGCEPASQGSSTQPASAEDNEAYIAALSVADDFCHAWKHRDMRAARALLSVRLLRAHPEEKVLDAIAGVPNPQHAAYEISGGEALADGRYAFVLQRFWHFIGRDAERVEAEKECLVIAREDGAWRVDDFPMP